MPALGTASDWVPVLLLLATGATAWLGLAAWQRRRSPGARPMALAALVVAVWCGLAAVAATSHTPSVKVLLVNLEIICQALLPVLWLLMVLELTGRRPWLRRAQPWLFIVPAVTVALAFTNSLLVSGGPAGAGVPLTSGPWSWVQSSYSGLLLALSLLALLRAWPAAAPLQRGQLAMLLACLLLPAAGLAAAELAGGMLQPAASAPVVLALCSLILVWAWFSFRLFDLAPLAQAAIVAGLREAVVVLDRDRRLADFNPAAAALFGWPVRGQRGQPAAQALADWPDLAKLVTEDAADPPAELARGLGAERRVFELSLTPLTDAHGQTLGQVLTLRDATEHHRIEDELARLATTDELTGLADHRRVFEALRDEVRRARRYESSLALLCLELDHFKALTEQLGRPAADAALRAVARALERLARQSDLPARSGSDEFILILPHTNLLGAETVAGRLVAAVSQIEVAANPTRPAADPAAGGRALSLSVGAAELAPDDDDQGEALLARAAQAMRAAQAAGGGRVMVSEGAAP